MDLAGERAREHLAATADKSSTPTAARGIVTSGGGIQRSRWGARSARRGGSFLTPLHEHCLHRRRDQRASATHTVTFKLLRPVLAAAACAVSHVTGRPRSPMGAYICGNRQYNLMVKQPWDTGSINLCLQDCICGFTLDPATGFLRFGGRESAFRVSGGTRTLLGKGVRSWRPLASRLTGRGSQRASRSF